MKQKQEHRWWEKLGLAFLICLGGVSASLAQEQVEKSGPRVEILKLKWEKQIRLPRNFDPSVISTGGAFSNPASRASDPNISPLDATRTASSAQSAAASSNNTFPLTPGQLPIFYVYSLKIRNTGSNLIEGVAWDYLFLDPNNNTELGRHQFLSYEKIPVNKSVTLQGQLRTPPVRVIKAPAAPQKNAHTAKRRFIEKAVIQCVLYADDTVWKNPSARDGVCETLKNSKSLFRRRRS